MRRHLKPARHPAPRNLDTLLALLNTAERRFDYHASARVYRDRLAGREDLERWLAGQGVVTEGTELSRDQHRRTVELRDSILRQIACEVAAGGPEDAETLRRLQELGEAARLRVRFDDLGPQTLPELEAAEGELEGALATWLWIFVSARREGHWSRVKRCEGCHKIFHDASPTGIVKYCSTRCGDRVRGRRHKTPRKRDYPKKPGSGGPEAPLESRENGSIGHKLETRDAREVAAVGGHQACLVEDGTCRDQQVEASDDFPLLLEMDKQPGVGRGEPLIRIHDSYP